ncbi:maleylpyruvate isomerase N-terminal domain-containing protein [Brachybacterium alimentarium]|uniref:maleylpyruvate isomerase N-terminal domain-containing protein n=1 Tax=Brachybacterium alimentarium TaxID=47845 RepID=UPI000DF3CAE8|nr:maleylpyruvate isomerase N-terminal domain-containing protein [Brachybacterium alimentarium]RCS77371.1 maleylpyruvate isomerase family mycothiol-dependent enzyme [Brachybacterium alimentarium]
MVIPAADIIREESERLAAALAAADPEQKVPTCPDWVAADLLGHITEVQDFWASVLAKRATTEAEVARIEGSAAAAVDDPAAAPELRRAATDALLAQLDSRGDDEPAWFWFSPEQSVGVIRRMQLHEATIHRVDAELTAGLTLTPIDSEVAHAGVDHVLQVMWPAVFEWIPEWATVRPVALVEIRLDGAEPGQLLISRWSGTRPRDGQQLGATVARPLTDLDEVGELPRAVVSGPPAAVDLWAWGRAAALGGLDGEDQKVEIIGDRAAISELDALLAAGIA